jgi:SAM-dependent methyltransferase
LDTVKLNLGCGDKVLPGYVNVDVAESRAGKRPDLLCDLHRLATFEDNSVDEILSVHVVEHFWRWEVVDVLKEWVRVLKPGGLMVLECPNLKSACETFLSNPEFHAGRPEGQRTMWVFYGDPSGATRSWFTAGLYAAGPAPRGGWARRHPPEPARFKLREPRHANGWREIARQFTQIAWKTSV